MAKIIEYLSQIGPGGLVGAPQANAISFGGGAGLTSLGNTIDELLQEKDRRDATAYVSEQSSKLQLDSLQTLNDMKTDGEPIDTFTDRFKKKYEDMSKPILENAPNDLARQAMQGHLDSIQTNLVSGAINYQAAQKINLLKLSSGRAVDNIINSATLDPANTDAYKTQLASTIASAGRYMTPAEQESFRQKSVSNFAHQQILTALNTDVTKAVDLLQANKDELSASDFASIGNKIGIVQDRLIKEQEATNLVISSLSGFSHLDPTNAEDKAAVNIFYDKVIDTNPDDAARLGMDYAVKTNIVPDTLKAELTGAIMAGTPEQVPEASRYISELYGRNRFAATSAFSKDVIIKAVEIDTLMKNGFNPSKAIEWANASIAEVKDKTVTYRTEKYNKEESFKEEINLSDKFGTLLSLDPTVPEEMNADYSYLAKRFFINDGASADAAKNLALKQLKQTWGKSFNNRMMRYAPETIPLYQLPDGTADYIPRQLEKTLKHLGNYKADDLIIEAKPESIKFGIPGSYLVFRKNNFGIPEPVLDRNNIPAEYTPAPQDTHDWKEQLAKRPKPGTPEYQHLIDISKTVGRELRKSPTQEELKELNIIP